MVLPPRLRIAAAHSRLALGLLSLLALLQFLQFLQSIFEPLLLFALCPLARLLGSRVGLFVPRITHLCHATPCSLQMLANGPLFAITPDARLRLNLPALLHHLLHRH